MTVASTTYKCHQDNSGSWVWTATPPALPGESAAACTAKYDTDCDGKTGNGDPDCTCSAHGDSTTCIADNKCEWCNLCSGTKYSASQGSCVNTGGCGYACTLSQCTASCASAANCPDTCAGSIRKTGGTCDGTCNCVYTSEDCATKASTDSDSQALCTTEAAQFAVGTVTDYTTCSGSTCSSAPHADSCAGTVITEYCVNGVSYSSTTNDCKGYENWATETATSCTAGQLAGCSSGACYRSAASGSGTNACIGTCGSTNDGCKYRKFYSIDNTANGVKEACTSTDYSTDVQQSYCTGCSLGWAIGKGDCTNANCLTQCCGDDQNEANNVREVGCTGDSPNGKLPNYFPSFASSNSDKACCNGWYECVYNGQCYVDDLHYVSPSQGGPYTIGTEKAACENGVWYDCDNSQGMCEESNGRCGYAGGWIFGGEQQPFGEYQIGTTLQCCGDDLSENKVARACTSGCTSDATDKACCNSASKCAYNGACYSDGFIGYFNNVKLQCTSGLWVASSGNNLTCGNGQVDIGEQCDATNMSGKTCSNFDGFTGGQLRCIGCKIDTTACTPYKVPGVCGDGVLNLGEECDCGSPWSCSLAELDSKTCQSFDNFVGGSLGCVPTGSQGECSFDTTSCAQGSAPLCTVNKINETSAYGYASGANMYYNPAGSGSFGVNVTVSNYTASQKIVFPATTSVGANDSIKPYYQTYTWGAASVFDAQANVVSYDLFNFTQSCQFQVVMDVTPPTTIANITSSDAKNYNLSINCTDSQSGCGTLVYCTDSSPEPTCNPSGNVYGGSFLKTCNDICWLRYIAQDNVGNIAVMQNVSYGPNALPPTGGGNTLYGNTWNVTSRITSVVVNVLNGLTVVATTTSDAITGSYSVSVSTGIYNVTGSKAGYTQSLYQAVDITSDKQLDIILGHGPQDCLPDCTRTSTPGVCAAICDGTNGCVFSDDQAAAACDAFPSGTSQDYSAGYRVLCCLGSPYAVATTPAESSSQSRDIATITRLVWYNGRLVRLVINTFN